MDFADSATSDDPVRKGGSSESRAFLSALLAMLSWRFVGLVLLTLLNGLVSGTSLLLLIPMLQVVGLEVSGGTGERLTEFVFRGMRAVGLEPALESVLALNAVVAVAAALLSRLQATLSADLTQSVVRGLRRRYYESVIRADWLYMAGKRSGRFTHLLLGELERIGAAMTAMVSLLVSSARAVVYCAIAVVLSPALALVTLGFGSIITLLLLHRTRLARARGQGVSDAYQDLYSSTGEHFAALKLIKSHALEGPQVDEFHRITDRVHGSHLAVVRNQADVGFWLQAGTVVALSALIYVALAVLQLPLTTVLLLLYLFSRLLPLLAGVQKNYQSLLNLLPAYAEFSAALSESDAARETSDECSQEVVLTERIELKDVSFSYRHDESRALHGIDLVIPVGKTTAVVGPSGAGKSTLADLVIGLIAPESGRVLIDDVPLSAERRRAWRRKVGYVSQDLFLFHGSVRSNLLLARPDANDDELWDALDSASAQFVRHLPEGLDTTVGERGVRLSGGERQRVVLARALLRKPALLVLDEATSSLDAENEVRIKEAIDRLSGRVTILVIAHRLASIRSADNICVIEGGRLVEAGKWDDLLGRQNGRFQSLARAQGHLPTQGEASLTRSAGSLLH